MCFIQRNENGISIFTFSIELKMTDIGDIELYIYLLSKASDFEFIRTNINCDFVIENTFTRFKIVCFFLLVCDNCLPSVLTQHCPTRTYDRMLHRNVTTWRYHSQSCCRPANHFVAVQDRSLSLYYFWGTRLSCRSTRFQNNLVCNDMNTSPWCLCSRRESDIYATFLHIRPHLNKTKQS